jgi:hypothetical protein
MQHDVAGEEPEGVTRFCRPRRAPWATLTYEAASGQVATELAQGVFRGRGEGSVDPLARLSQYDFNHLPVHLADVGKEGELHGLLGLESAAVRCAAMPGTKPRNAPATSKASWATSRCGGARWYLESGRFAAGREFQALIEETFDHVLPKQSDAPVVVASELC